MYWVIEVRHDGEWVRKGGSKRRRYYSAEAAEEKARGYRARHPHREVRVRRVPADEYLRRE